MQFLSFIIHINIAHQRGLHRNSHPPKKTTISIRSNFPCRPSFNQSKTVNHPYRLDIFDEMSASEELDDNQVRQILFDLDSAYNAFNRILHDH